MLLHRLHDQNCCQPEDYRVDPVLPPGSKGVEILTSSGFSTTLHTYAPAFGKWKVCKTYVTKIHLST